MKYLFILLLLALNSCKKEKDNFFVLNQSFTIAPDAKACFNKENICITLNKVKNDSRCPLGAVCIWEGVAVVDFTFYSNEKTYPFTLHTTDNLQYHNDTIIQGYTIKLQQLNPYPKLNKHIDEKDYRAQIIINK